ncbi:MAG: helix-turn-helix transcriptional regulator [Thermoleophilaceae bacterium]
MASSPKGSHDARTPLERERRAQGLSRPELARRAGVDRGSVWRAEVGRVYPHPITRVALAAALELDPHAVFPEDEA